MENCDVKGVFRCTEYTLEVGIKNIFLPCLTFKKLQKLNHWNYFDLVFAVYIGKLEVIFRTYLSGSGFTRMQMQKIEMRLNSYFPLAI